ncbi:MAG: SgcJ/EcaC family oxidoreductase [Proteobacteria bacterium]|nr:SgcJ/EcaC family oxidoreductase [Pseudomonadota bacterium]
MRRVLTTVALFASFCAVAVAGPKEEALQVVDKWTRAFTESDVDGIVKLYASDALFFGTGSKTLVTKTEDIRKYFEAALLTNRPRGATVGDHSVAILSDTVVAITGLDNVTGTRDGKVYSAIGRTTFVVAKRESGWQIVHFHRSAMPN